jgi:hypothetical protein
LHVEEAQIHSRNHSCCQFEGVVVSNEGKNDDEDEKQINLGKLSRRILAGQVTSEGTLHNTQCNARCNKPAVGTVALAAETRDQQNYHDNPLVEWSQSLTQLAVIEEVAHPTEDVVENENTDQRPEEPMEPLNSVQLVLSSNLFVLNVQREVVQDIVGFLAVEVLLLESLEAAPHFQLLIHLAM